jgi:hypothetical protein
MPRRAHSASETSLMRALLIAVISVLLCVSFADARDGSRVEYLGGTRPDIPTDKTGEIRLTDNTYFVFLTRKTEVKIPYERINLVEYGQQVDRRYLAAMISPAFALMKKREHFLTLGFQDDDGHQQAMLFRINKDDVRLTLISLEARTGQSVQYQDDEARIAGK